MSGTLPISSFFTRVLFDSGLSHFFIYPRFAKKLAKAPITINLVMSLATPLERSMITNKVIRDYRTHIGDWELIADLILLKIVDFDIILGMDYMSFYHVVVDYF